MFEIVVPEVEGRMFFIERAVGEAPTEIVNGVLREVWLGRCLEAKWQTSISTLSMSIASCGELPP